MKAISSGGRFLYRFLEIFFLLVAAWMLFALLLSGMRINSGFVPPAKGVKIFIRSNGVHTDFVVPVRNQFMHWDSLLPWSDCNADSTYTHVAIGWGDKGFFLDCPTWDDLTFSTAFVAGAGIGESALHVQYMKSAPAESERVISFMISEEQYRSLNHFITSSFTDKITRINHAGYGPRDCFYEAKGSYSIFMTCNEWTGDGMEACGLPVGVWTPLEPGIMLR